ncbi:hypothetical protein Ddye_027495 [Dipteronia dyeriana]|uniref:Cyclic nucleotide-binding domain-containing protein n=1 Tax=Dipteronia dyeriana TaxID=168575 RepID=A0AAD9TQ50_9ROSI|nr:hypothetical protein Ddye_027495 [Dipteronia dyeriana]
MSGQFVNLEDGTSRQLMTGHRNGTNTEGSGPPDNSGVEVQGISSSNSSGRKSTRPALFHWKNILSKVWPLVDICPFIWCSIRISVEPSFLYATMINYDTKCLEFDNTFNTVGLYILPFQVLVTIGSFAFLARARKLGLLQRIIWFLFLLLGSSSFIPIGTNVQLENVIWPYIGPRHRGTNFYSANLFLSQYFLMVILIYKMFTRATRTWATLAKATWAKAAFNLLLYIHGGHVFGGLWYAFAIAKEVECWKKACKHPALDCPPNNSLYNAFEDYKCINEFCSIKTRNTTAYDFGIYHDALESGIVNMRNFPSRVLYCFRWGLQNLSALGQNIQTSTDAWENIFVVSITIYGVVLFVLFIGNMQIYLQSQINRSEIIRQKKKEIEQSKSFEKLPENFQKQIKRYQPEKWEESVEFGNLFNNLPDDLRKNIKRQLCLESFLKVEEFRSWSEELLHELSDCAKAISYAEHAEIVRRGSSIDEMLFLVQGKLRTYSLTSVDTGSTVSPPLFEMSINHLKDSEFCGEELVDWFQADLYSFNLPISTRTIQTTTKVDAFALMYYDLQNVFIKHQTARSKSTQVQQPPAKSQSPQAPPPPAESLVQQPTSRI